MFRLNTSMTESAPLIAHLNFRSSPKPKLEKVPCPPSANATLLKPSRGRTKEILGSLRSRTKTLEFRGRAEEINLRLTAESLHVKSQGHTKDLTTTRERLRAQPDLRTHLRKIIPRSKGKAFPKIVQPEPSMLVVPRFLIFFTCFLAVKSAQASSDVNTIEVNIGTLWDDEYSEANGTYERRECQGPNARFPKSFLSRAGDQWTSSGTSSREFWKTMSGGKQWYENVKNGYFIHYQKVRADDDDGMLMKVRDDDDDGMWIITKPYTTACEEAVCIRYTYNTADRNAPPAEGWRDASSDCLLDGQCKNSDHWDDRDPEVCKNDADCVWETGMRLHRYDANGDFSVAKIISDDVISAGLRTRRLADASLSLLEAKDMDAMSASELVLHQRHLRDARRLAAKDVDSMSASQLVTHQCHLKYGANVSLVMAELMESVEKARREHQTRCR